MKVLVTGACGLIGNLAMGHLWRQPERFDVFGLDVNPSISKRINSEDVFQIPPERFFQVDLENLDTLTHAANGMDAVVHMAADSGEWCMGKPAEE